MPPSRYRLSVPNACITKRCHVFLLKWQPIPAEVCSALKFRCLCFPFFECLEKVRLDYSITALPGLDCVYFDILYLVLQINAKVSLTKCPSSLRHLFLS